MTGPSYQLNDDEIRYLSLLLRVIDAQNWEAFEYAILNNPEAFQNFSRTISRSEELNGMTILHACIRFNPPPHILKILLTLVPESPSCVDCLQRTPLHVAAGTRCTLSTIKLLTEAYPRACAIQDDDGKTPLMMACDISCELFEEDADKTREPPSFEVVKTLIKAAPWSVPKEDKDDMSALEYAIFSDAPIKVVKLLQKATQKQCEAQQARMNDIGMMKNSRRRSTVESQDSTVLAMFKVDLSSPTIAIPARVEVRRNSRPTAA